MKDHGVWLVLALVALRYVDEANLSSCGARSPSPRSWSRQPSELDFDIPIGKNGDCYDRYLFK
jgi:hypothetical protein